MQPLWLPMWLYAVNVSFIVWAHSKIGNGCVCQALFCRFMMMLEHAWHLMYFTVACNEVVKHAQLALFCSYTAKRQAWVVFSQLISTFFTLHSIAQHSSLLPAIRLVEQRLINCHWFVQQPQWDTYAYTTTTTTAATMSWKCEGKKISLQAKMLWNKGCLSTSEKNNKIQKPNSAKK